MPIAGGALIAGLPFAAFALVGAVPTVVVGLRMIQRHRAEAAAV